jgi:hypothetical protein
MLQFLMIRTFRHEGLKALYEKNQSKGFNPQWLKRIRTILARLDASKGRGFGLLMCPATGALFSGSKITSRTTLIYWIIIQG